MATAQVTKTRADLAAAALREIRVLRGGEVPTAVQRSQSDEKYDALYDELAVLGVGFWDREALPALIFDPMTMLVAARLAPSFGKVYAPGDAMQRLYSAASRPWTGRTVRTEYF